MGQQEAVDNDVQESSYILSRLQKFPGKSGSGVLDLWNWTWIFIVLVVFMAGELTGNWSQEDKLWSLLPTLYIWEALLLSPRPRLVLMAMASTAWSVRLTYNFIPAMATAGLHGAGRKITGGRLF